jgi:hypothetical protein
MRWIASLVAICFSVQLCIGAVINVPADQPTIQAGIEASSDGDTVLVARGTYVEDITFCGRAILLTSTHGRDTTTIHFAGTSASIVTFENGEDTTSIIDGFTITNSGLNNGCRHAIMCDGSSPIIRNCDISHCRSYERDGLGIYCSYSVAKIRNNRIHDIVADWLSSGVIFCRRYTQGTLEIVENEIYNNICIKGSTLLTVPGCSNLLIARNLIRDNTDYGEYPDFEYPVAIDLQMGYADIINNTIVSNISGIYLYSGNSVDVRNNIITSNSQHAMMGANASADYNDMWNNGVDTDPGPNGISADPMFRDETDNVFYLHGHSPCIDAGDPDSAYSDPDGTRSDIGAIPFQACGNADGSGGADIDDAVYLINYIFSVGPAPTPIESGDADCSGDIDIDDVVYLIMYLFSGGNAPRDTDGNEVPDC